MAEIQAVMKGILYLLPGHGIQGLTVILGKNVAVLAALVTVVCNMPLKGKILFHVDVLTIYI